MAGPVECCGADLLRAPSEHNDEREEREGVSRLSNEVTTPGDWLRVTPSRWQHSLEQVPELLAAAPTQYRERCERMVCILVSHGHFLRIHPGYIRILKDTQDTDVSKSDRVYLTRYPQDTSGYAYPDKNEQNT